MITSGCTSKTGILQKSEIIESFDSEVVYLLNKWLNSSPDNSLRLMERISGVNRQTLRNLKLNTRPAHKLEFKSIIQLLVFLTKLDISDVISKYQEAFNEFWLKDVSKLQIQKVAKETEAKSQIDLEKTKKEHTDKLTVLLQDPDTLSIYCTSQNKKGVSFEKLKSIMGDKFLDKAYELADLKAVSIDLMKETVFNSNNLYIGFSRGQIQKIVPSYVKHYSPKRSGTDSNFISMRSRSINADAMKRITRILEEASVKIDHIMSEEVNLGDIPYFATLVADRFIE